MAFPKPVGQRTTFILEFEVPVEHLEQRDIHRLSFVPEVLIFHCRSFFYQVNLPLISAGLDHYRLIPTALRMSMTTEPNEKPECTARTTSLQPVQQQ